MEAPCSAIAAGDTVRSLSKGYVHNTTCIYKYELLLKKQRKYSEQIRELYNAKPNKQQ